MFGGVKLYVGVAAFLLHIRESARQKEDKKQSALIGGDDYGIGFCSVARRYGDRYSHAGRRRRQWVGFDPGEGKVLL